MDAQRAEGNRAERTGRSIDDKAAATPRPRVEPEPGLGVTIEPAADTREATQDALHVLLHAGHDAYRHRVSEFNRARRRAAGEALRRLRPQPEDYDGFEHARERYAIALQLFRGDRYVRRLQELIEQANHAVVPVFHDGEEAPSDPTRLTLPQLRRALAALGLPLTANARAEHIASACLILATVPNELLLDLLSPLAMLAMRQAPAHVRVALDDRPDPMAVIDDGLRPSLRVALRLEAEHAPRGPRPAAQRHYRWASRLAQLPSAEKRLVALSPLLGAIMDGQPVAWVPRFRRLALRYDGLITASQAWQVERGQTDGLPNPLDPLRMPAGAAFILDGETLHREQLEGALRILGGDVDALRRSRLGVRRLDGTRVEVLAGSENAVDHLCLFGQDAGPPPVPPELRRVPLDLATDAGRRAYRRFLATGTVPCEAADPPTHEPAEGGSLH